MEGLKKSIALVGAGYWGKNLLRNLYQIGVLHTVCEANKNLVETYRENYSDIYYTSSYEKVLNNEAIKAVVIATPAATHYELALKALQAEKDVFVEKPLALSVKEGEELVEEASKRNLILMVGHVLEYHPAVQKLYQLIKEGALGRIRYLYSNRLNWGRFRTEENILWSFAPHDIALILRILGTMPQDVISHGESYLNPDLADVTLTVLKFSKEIQAHIFVSWLHPFKEQRFVVVGDKQIAVFDDTQSWEEKLVLYPHQVEWQNGQIPIARKAEKVAIPLEQKEPLRAEMEHFIQCIAERKKPLTDGESALQVLKILNAAQKSLDNKGKTVLLKSEFIKEDVYVHPTAVVDKGAKIGKGTKVWHFSHVMVGANIGENCVLGQNVFVGRNVRIGNGVKIQNNVSIYEGVILENDVFCGPACVFTNVLTPRAFIERKSEFLPTLVKQGATIGANATIVCGNTIGKYAMVGAGAVVVSDVEDYALYIGVPAKKVGWVCKCGFVLVHKNEIKGNIRKKEVNKIELSCPYCESIYMLEDNFFYPLEENV